MGLIRDMRPGEESEFHYQRKGFMAFCEDYIDGKGLVVEVGSWKGESAIMMSFYAQQVVCFDDYACPLPPDAQFTMEDVCREFAHNIQPYTNITHRRVPSVAGARTLLDRSIDAVYIDASHIYHNVLADIRAWSPKVRPGGVIAGHDYDLPGVKRAVSEVFGEPERTYGDNTWVVTA